VSQRDGNREKGWTDNRPPPHQTFPVEQTPHDINLSRRQHSRNALFDALHQLSGTHYRKLFLIVFFWVFKSRLKTFLFSQGFPSFSVHWHAICPQRLWSYDLTALYKSVLLLLLLLLYSPYLVTMGTDMSRRRTRGCAGKTVKSSTTRAIPQRFCSEVASLRGVISSVWPLLSSTYAQSNTTYRCRCCHQTKLCW